MTSLDIAAPEAIKVVASFLADGCCHELNATTLEVGQCLSDFAKPATGSN